MRFGMSSRADERDVVVVGAGVAGGAIAYTLAKAGARVVLVDQGPEIHPVERPILSSDWEFALGREWHFDPNVRGLAQDYPVKATGFDPYMFNAVGGSTNHYGGFWHRLKPVDFRKGTEHGLESARDWPISYEDLAPFYDLNDRIFGVSGHPGDPSYPPRPSPPLRPLRHGSFFGHMARAFEQLGWHWWAGDSAIISEAYDDRLPCNGCGHCNAGCPRGSVSTATIAYITRGVALGLDLRPNTRVLRVMTDGQGAATGVECVDLESGKEERIGASLVVVACNAIGTPRLLLNSANSTHPDGLGNAHDLVGRHLMLHGWLITDVWLDERTEHYKGPATSSMYCQEFYDSDPDRGFVNGFTITVSGDFGPAFIALGGATGLNPVRWGKGHHEDFDQRFGRHLYLSLQSDDLPSESNRVTLDHELTDSSGMPAARAHYELHENDRQLLRFAAARIAEVTEAVGARAFNHADVDGPYRAPGWHLMGTCRIGTTPETSVADEWHRVWGVPNLVVCDSSSFVTGGAGNPAATVAALGLRCATHLVEQMGRKVEAPVALGSPVSAPVGNTTSEPLTRRAR
jgi:choline dehydrogenase-like flavoprotein